MIINKEKYKIDNINYRKTIKDKNQIIIEFSLRKDNHHLKRLLHKEFGKTKKWNTYTVSRDGEIFEHYNPKYCSDFIGNKTIDNQSISITIENMGGLIRNGDVWVNGLNEICDDKRVVEKPIFGFKYWETIDHHQIQQVFELCDMLCDKYSIDRKCIEFNHYHNEIKKFNGIVFKRNYIENSLNMNPLFPIQELNEYLKIK